MAELRVCCEHVIRERMSVCLFGWVALGKARLHERYEEKESTARTLLA